MIAAKVMGLLLALWGLAPQGPPPPEVGLVRVVGPDVDAETLHRSEGTLTTLVTRRYIALRETPLKDSDFTPCLTEADGTRSCIEQTLSRLQARPGDIVVLVEAADDGFRWTCVGKPVEAFEPDHQVFRRLFRARTDDDLNAVFNRASACLTYAGHQSGW